MIKLIFIFMYIGSFTIGGGLVAITLIQEQLVGQGYITVDRLIDMISIAESTPGPIGINMATFVGFELYGLIGAIIVSIAFIIPSFLVVELLYQPLIKYQKTLLVKSVFLFIKASVVGFLMYTLYTLASVSFVKESNIEYKTMLITLIVLIASKWIKKPILLIVLGGILGFIFYGVGL
jgi:chromate transporter